jgi:hypothetical protein
MNPRQFSPVLALLVFLSTAALAVAQDNVRGGAEPIVRAIDPATLRYDYLVDADLKQDDPANKKFRTLPAAYAAAPAGTEEKPTLIGLRPGVYQLPDAGSRQPSLRITKNWITFLGLTDNRRAVVLADNRGLMQGADDDGYLLDVNATGFSLRNLTVINYCNTDYEYPGDARKNLTKRSDVITQAVALQAAGDKHVYENVALLGRLDTMFLRTTRSYFKNVYIEGTDDWMGGGQMSVWEDSTLVYPTGRGVMSASNVVFRHCRFEAARGMEFYKVEFRSAERPVVLIDCVVPENTAWSRGKATPRPNQYSLTYRVKNPAEKPAVIPDCTVGPPTFTYSRELSGAELPAFNSWNLLRAPPSGPPDDWDPAGVRANFEKAGQGSLVYRMALTGGAPSIRTGGQSATIGASVLPARVTDPTITWSTKSDLVSLSRTTGPSVAVTGTNSTDRAQWVPINATAANGFFVTAWILVEPRYLTPPAIAVAPTLSAPANGNVKVNYTLDLGGRDDQSLVTWSACDDATGANPREIGVSRGDVPLKEYRLTAGDIGKYLKVTLQPKHNISDPGPAVFAMAAKPITASDVTSLDVSPNFRNFPTTTNEAFVDGRWTVLGTWSVVAGDHFVNGYGIRPTTPGALFYQTDADCGDMEIDLTMTPEKTEGTGFSVPGSPDDHGDRNLHADIYIKYDPRTKNGYALRFWRTTRSAAACMFQFYRIENGVGSPLDEKQALTGVFKPTTRLTLKVTGTTISATAANDVDHETLSLTGTIVPNRFGGAGVSWPRGSTNVYSRLAISYPRASVAN